MLHYQGTMEIVSQQRSNNDEVLLADNPNRFVLFPIQYMNVFRFYKKAQESYWTAEEVDLSGDRADYERMSLAEQHFLGYILAFFAAGDGIVLENLAGRFMTEVQLPEARCFYGFQIAMENIHSEVYSLLIDELIRDPVQKDILFSAIHKLPSVARKAEWAQRWLKSDASFGERLVAFIGVEGVQFSSGFGSIGLFKTKGTFPGLTFSNEKISLDEGLHQDFGCELFWMLKNKPSEERVREIICGLVDVECDFVDDILPQPLLGIDADALKQYVKYVADRILVQLGQDRHYGVTNSLPYMEQQDLLKRTNIFEKRNPNYSPANACSKGGFSMTAEF